MWIRCDSSVVFFSSTSLWVSLTIFYAFSFLCEKKEKKRRIDLFSYYHSIEKKISTTKTRSTLLCKTKLDPMALRLTLSCDLNQSESGPTLIHSTGVQHYRIPPEVVSQSVDVLFSDVFVFFLIVYRFERYKIR